MIGEPPWSPGAENETETEAFPAVAVSIVGAPGTVAGVTLSDAADGEPLPTPFVESTVQFTGTPFVRPETTMGDAAPELLCVPHVAV